MEYTNTGFFLLVLFIIVAAACIYLMFIDTAYKEKEQEEEVELGICEESCDWEGECVERYCVQRVN